MPWENSIISSFRLGIYTLVDVVGHSDPWISVRKSEYRPVDAALMPDPAAFEPRRRFHAVVRTGLPVVRTGLMV
jgi:hypothetical protein